MSIRKSIFFVFVKRDLASEANRMPKITNFPLFGRFFRNIHENWIAIFLWVFVDNNHVFTFFSTNFEIISNSTRFIGNFWKLFFSEKFNFFLNFALALLSILFKSCQTNIFYSHTTFRNIRLKFELEKRRMKGCEEPLNTKKWRKITKN